MSYVVICSLPTVSIRDTYTPGLSRVWSTVKLGISYPQVREEQGSLVDLYMKTANNLGVTLSRLAKRNSNSMYNARAMSLLTESTRAWDALTRNQATMIRLEGTNLAAQNLKYMTVPNSTYEPEIYTAIPRVLYGEKMLSQPDVD